MPLPRSVVYEPLYLEDAILPGEYRYWITSEGPGGVSEAVSILVVVPFVLLPTATPASTPTATLAPTATPVPTTLPSVQPTPESMSTPIHRSTGYVWTYPTSTQTPQGTDTAAMEPLSHRRDCRTYATRVVGRPDRGRIPVCRTWIVRIADRDRTG